MRKLTDEQIAEMKHLYYDCKFKQRELAEKFGVTQTTVSMTLNPLTRENNRAWQRKRYRERCVRVWG